MVLSTLRVLTVGALLIFSGTGCAYAMAANDPSIPTVFIFLGFVFAVIAAIGAGVKNREEVGWSQAGFWLGPVGLLVFALDKLDEYGHPPRQSDAYLLPRFGLAIVLLAIPIGFLLIVDMDEQTGDRIRTEQYLDAEAQLRERDRQRESDAFYREYEIERRRLELERENR